MTPRRQAIVPIIVHAIRCACVVALLLLIPPPRQASSRIDSSADPPPVKLIQRHFRDATTTRETNDARWEVLDIQGNLLGYAARTLPDANDIVGYRGPSEALILIDDKQNLIAVDLIQSSDTDEHVDAVRDSEAFFVQFQSWTWGKPSKEIDAVSGATLTSLALAGGVIARMGDAPPSLVFPDPVELAEMSKWFPDAASQEQIGFQIKVLDPENQPLGTVWRTGPLSDSIIGYQGPTELLLRLDPVATEIGQAVLDDVLIRSSFDNEPYVGYCKTEYSFWSRFKGQTLSQLSAMDLEEAGVEGVSGATMTSMAIAETIVAFSEEGVQRVNALSEKQKSSGLSEKWKSLGIRWSTSDWFCIGILLCIPVLRRLGWFRSSRLRKLWLTTVIIVIGLWSGNLVSMALIAGWSAQGIAWRLAPGLAAIAAVAIVSPGLGKSNPYCNHLCPHGAIQQLVRPKKSNRRFLKLPPRLAKGLAWLPGSLLVLAYLLLLFDPSTDLSSWEPFHAYLYSIAPWTAIAFALATLFFSAFVPMGFCRLGCPTGRLLDHLRRNASSHRIHLADTAMMGLLVIALFVRNLS